MAYDHERKEEIDAMGVADLIHTMLVEFDPHYREFNGGPGYPGMQSNAYFWAYDRLGDLLPANGAAEDHTAANDAADAATHGF